MQEDGRGGITGGWAPLVFQCWARPLLAQF